MLNELYNGYIVETDSIIPNSECNLLQALINDQIYFIKLDIKPTCIGEFIANKFMYSLGYGVAQSFIGKYSGQECIILKDFIPNGCEYISYSELLESNPEYKSLSIDRLAEVLPMERRHRFGMQRQYWGQFICDALLGNCHRTPDDWGFLFDKSTGKYRIAPIHSNAHSLMPNLMDKIDECQFEIISWKTLATIGMPFNNFQPFSYYIPEEIPDSIFGEELIQLRSIGASKIISAARQVTKPLKDMCTNLMIDMYIKLIVLRYLCIVCKCSYEYAIQTYRKFEGQAELRELALLDSMETGAKVQLVV